MPASDLEDIETLRVQAAVLRDRHGLGRSPALSAMFDYLLATSLEGRAPKEAEVADAVFARGGEFDTMQDASVRVYAFRLRKKLDEFYAGDGADQPFRILLAKGEYRLAVARQAERAAQNAAAAAATLPRRVVLLAIAATTMVCAVIGAAMWLALWRPDAPDRAMAEARASKLWSATVTDGKPIVVVVGDYYIFGEADEGGAVRRLVREFAINSRYDLDRRAMEDPAIARRYRDVGLRYYPIGVAAAIRDVMPVLRTAGRRERPIRVIPVSMLTPDMLRISNVVYIGYFSGLGALRDAVFNGSRFAVGGSYDELIDKKSGTAFAASGSLDGVAQDYGYVATFAGPNQNRIVIIAGTRDPALMQAADYVWRAPMLGELDRRTGTASSFEALFRVETMDGENLAGKLLSASAIDDRAVWRGGTPQAFPDDSRPRVPPGF